MPLTLPSCPTPRFSGVRPITSRAEARSGIGNAWQRANLGPSAYAADFDLPSMFYTQAMEWGDLEDETQTVILPIRQPGLVIGNPGAAVRVNGNNQTGDQLVVDGLTPGYVVRKGQFFSLSIAGQLNLYKARAAVTANGSGQATILLRTRLRGAPVDNTLIDFMTPKMEGYAVFDPGIFGASKRGVVPAFSFSIEERD